MQRFDAPIYVYTDPEVQEAAALVARLTAERDALQQKLAACLAPPAPPPPSGLPLVPFTIPPLLLNKPFFGFDSGFGTNKLEVNVSMSRQPLRRVIRRDYGLQDPAQAVGSGGFLREPIGKDMRYAITVHVPADYDPVDMNNVFQLHGHIGGDPPYLSFFLWTTSSRWRHIHPDGQAVDLNVSAIQFGHDYRLEVAARWSRGTDGYLKIWQDGEQALDYRGPTIKASDVAGPYILFGQYYPAVSAEFDNTLFFSNFRRGGS